MSTSSYWGSRTPDYGGWWRIYDPTKKPAAAATPVQQPVETSVATGIDPSAVANALYGKIIPLSALGLARIGTAGLIFGPYFAGDVSARTASFAVSFGFPANPEGTRRVYEIALDGKVAWELGAGSPEGVLNPAGFLGDPFECRFYSGTQTQPADPLEIAMFGAEAVAYRPQMCLWFTNLPVTAFDNKCPFVSAKIGDATDHAINLGTALEMVAYSPWLEYDSGSFETTGVADIVQGMILTEDQSFLDLLQVTARVYRTLDILQTDKLRINDRGSTVEPDVALHRDHIAADGSVQLLREEQSSVPRELELMTIDPDADYIFIPSKAARPRSPVPVTSSVAKDSITLPVVIDSATRASLVTYAKYQEDNARKRINLQTMLFGYALEPGDLIRLVDVADGFDNGEVYKVVETSHGANYINELSAEAILKCAFDFADGDPWFTDVLLLLHAESGPPIDSSSYDEPYILEGGAYIDTAISKFGLASFAFDGTGDRVRATHEISHINLSPTNTSPYTIELWVRFTALPGLDNQMLVCQNSALVTTRVWSLYVPTSLSDIRFTTSDDGVTVKATVDTAGAALANGVWYHIAADKDSTGKVRLYVNGVMKGSATPANSVIVFNPSITITVGAAGADFQAPFAGNIDDVRITGRSRYGDVYGDASFPPPIFQFPDHI